MPQFHRCIICRSTIPKFQIFHIVVHIIRMINDMGISVVEEAPDEDTLMMSDHSTDESAAEEAVAALAAVESDVGRTTDPVRMYMREMGTVELLTREGEIVIAKCIEEGIREVMHALAYWPGCIDTVLGEYRRVTDNEEGRLSEVSARFGRLSVFSVWPRLSGLSDVSVCRRLPDRDPLGEPCIMNSLPAESEGRSGSDALICLPPSKFLDLSFRIFIY